ncbi:MAG TPA: hypothetical protein V6C57_22055, partial [Coleofasciculaceae cyanobacterium]
MLTAPLGRSTNRQPDSEEMHMQWMEFSINTTHEAVDWVNTLLRTTDYTGDVHVTEYDQSLDYASKQPDWIFKI